MNPVATTTLVKGARASRSTVALKIVMAVSGLLFVLFVLAHMYGNLKMFAGHDAFNTYAEHLRTFGEPILPYGGLLWILRVGLLVALAAHIWSAMTLWKRANGARRVKYVAKRKPASALSSRWMRWGGITILLFVVWHLLNFTIGKVNVSGGATNDPYNLVVDTFATWWMTIIYLVAMVAVGLHLHHGVWSASQTLGWTNTAASRARAKALGLLTAVVIAGGFSLVPIFVLAGVISK